MWVVSWYYPDHLGGKGFFWNFYGGGKTSDFRPGGFSVVLRVRLQRVSRSRPVHLYSMLCGSEEFFFSETYTILLPCFFLTFFSLKYACTGHSQIMMIMIIKLQCDGLTANNE